MTRFAIFVCTLLLSSSTDATIQNRNAAEIAVALEIRGTVVEPGINRPVHEAEIFLFKAAPPDTVVTASTYTPETAVARATTDINGSFHFGPARFGQYRVEARKQGYRSAGALDRGVTTAADVTLTSERPRRDVQLLLARPAEIRGRVVDDRTDSPVPSQAIVALQLMYNSGRRRGLPVGFSVTSPTGEFTIRDLPPAEYAIRVRPKPFGKERFLPDFNPKDAELTDPGYEQMQSTLEEATPLAVRSGDLLDIGTIALRPVHLYRVSFSFPAGVCPQDATVNVAIANVKDGAYETVSDVRCSNSFVVRGLPAGQYRAEVFLRDQEPEQQLRASVQFQVTDKNLSIQLPLTRGVDITGRIRFAEGAKELPLEQIQLLMPAVGGVLRREDMTPVAVNQKGEFQARNVGTGEKQLDLSGIPKSHYTKEVTYNGSRISRKRWFLDPNQTAHVIEVVLDDRPGAITGAVKDGDKAVNQPYVLAVPAEARSDSDQYPLNGTNGDDSGKFIFEALPPGDYTVAAVPGAFRPDLENPQTLDAVLRNAKKVTVGSRSVQNVTLELVQSGK